MLEARAADQASITDKLSLEVSDLARDRARAQRGAEEAQAVARDQLARIAELVEGMAHKEARLQALHVEKMAVVDRLASAAGELDRLRVDQIKVGSCVLPRSENACFPCFLRWGAAPAACVDQIEGPFLCAATVRSRSGAEGGGHAN